MSAPDPITAQRRTRAARGDGDRLRDQLLDAASELVHEHGDASGLSIRQVTRRAGVSPTALYLHFDSLPDLVGELIGHGFTRFRAALLAASGEVPCEDARGRMTALGLAYLRFAREEPALYSVIFGPEHERQAGEGEHDHEGVGMAAFEDLVGAIANCQVAGQARSGDPRSLAIGVWSTMHGFATLCAVHDDERMPWPQDDAFIAQLYDAWLA